MTFSASRSVFDTLPDGREVAAVTLTNGTGMTATIIAWGATWQRMIVPDRDRQGADIVLGHDTIEPYINQPTYVGSIVGRCANRIADGQFRLDGKTYELTRNDGRNSLHGGVEGFDKRLWTVEAFGDDAGAWVTLSLVSPDGDQGYPGELRALVTYRLSEDALTMELTATSNAPTVCNLTNHAMFNLRGASSGEVATEGVLTLAADTYTPIDDNLIPTGELRPVGGTAFDFTRPRRIRDGVRDGRDAQIRVGRGYDHNFVLRGGRTAEPKLAAVLYDPPSGRQMTILTTEPGLQVYSGNFLDGTPLGKGGVLIRQGDGMALEAQVFPDSPNQTGFPDAVLRPGQVYRQTTVHRFSVG